MQSFNGLKTLTSLWGVGSVLNQIMKICKAEADMVSWWEEMQAKLTLQTAKADTKRKRYYYKTFIDKTKGE